MNKWKIAAPKHPIQYSLNMLIYIDVCLFLSHPQLLWFYAFDEDIQFYNNLCVSTFSPSVTQINSRIGFGHLSHAAAILGAMSRRTLHFVWFSMKNLGTEYSFAVNQLQEKKEKEKKKWRNERMKKKQKLMDVKKKND